ncbi:hypothetical protein R3P38DRAFT_2848845 [Favolaschia claudopus]|uniref:Uncharacterized protein n=1 Tax=Favolaschia claudopus TaxID=2862362 RepID=A0AAW0DWY0_9AGAR
MSTSDKVAIYRMVSVDYKGKHRPLLSLGLSALIFGTITGAYGTVFGGIPYAVEGAVHARPGLRLPTAMKVLRTSSPAVGRWVGASMAIVPVSTYIVDSLGFEDQSFFGQWMAACLTGSWTLFLQHKNAFVRDARLLPFFASGGLTYAALIATLSYGVGPMTGSVGQ